MDDWTKAVECLQEIKGCISPLIGCYERNEDPAYFLDTAYEQLLTAFELKMDDRWPESRLALFAIGHLISGVRNRAPDLVRLMWSERLPGTVFTLRDLAERMDETIREAMKAIERDRPKPPIEQRAGMDAVPLKLPHAPAVAADATKRRTAREVNVPAELAMILHSEKFKTDCDTYRSQLRRRAELEEYYSKTQIADRLNFGRQLLNERRYPTHGEAYDRLLAKLMGVDQ